MVLYKYLSSEFVSRIRAEGKMLFRNLSYFKTLEDKVRGDKLEGTHVDKGISGDGFDVILRSGFKLKGEEFVNSINEDKIFVLCFSTVFDENLFNEFGCDACIKINDADKIIYRCKRTIANQRKINNFNYGNVEYYEYHKATSRDFKNPINIPLFKPAFYSKQNEFRIYFAIEDGFTLKKQIIIKGNPFNLHNESSPPTLTSKEIILEIGNIEKVSEVIYKIG